MKLICLDSTRCGTVEGAARIAFPRLYFARLVPLFLLGLSGCAELPQTSLAPVEHSAAACVAAFEQLDAMVERAGVRDAEAARVPGFPFLRIDRLLAAVGTTVRDPAGRTTWLARLAALDAEARQHELVNLAGVHRERLPTRLALDDCRQSLITEIAGDPRRFNALRAAAVVPDDYRTWQRVIGVYPVAARFALSGLARLQRDFPVSSHLSTTDSTVLAYGSSNAAPTMSTPTAFARDALEIPIVSEALLAQLFARHAPQWRIATLNDNDRIGRPVWRYGRVAVDVSAPTVFTYLSYTRFESRVLLQLNYVVWFAARPSAGPFDLLAGALDGLTWRVTLDDEGHALLYDSIHNCGCYHLWFPTSRLILRRPSEGGTEPPWVPFEIPEAEGQMVVELASATHYVRGIGRADTTALIPLARADYDVLRSLPQAATRSRSIFGTDGVIAGSERGERFVLWPLGVPAPGAMRSRGHQATAFVGRRHFDDADLIGRYFTRE
ncbi:MAG: hypothetical protein HYX63_15560 [Gammaproteobacteria bacterium]|nr:hypothetical protein [Gammaproteobacteria bacterium]